MEEIESLLDDWFCAEYAARTTHPTDRPTNELRKEARTARSALAYRLIQLRGD